MDIDWFSWLARTSLDSSLVYDYALIFSQNELEQDDITYFNHEFLQSMGISIAKHRLEILKLAKREMRHLHRHHHPVSNIIVAIKRTKKRLTKCIRSLVHREETGGGGAIVIVPRRSYSASRSKGMAMLKRNNKVVMMTNDNIQGQLLLTNGSPLMLSGQNNTRVHSFSSPLIVHHRDLQQDSEKTDLDNEEDDDPYWSSRMEIRWEAMFQDLKPT